MGNVMMLGSKVEINNTPIGLGFLKSSCFYANT